MHFTNSLSKFYNQTPLKVLWQPWNQACFFISVASIAEQQQRLVLHKGPEHTDVLAALPDCKHLVWAGVCPGLRDGRTARHSPYLAQEPGMVLGESCPVGVRGDSGILEAVLDGGGCADVLVQELLPCLLRDSFGWHGHLVWNEKQSIKSGNQESTVLTGNSQPPRSVKIQHK